MLFSNHVSVGTAATLIAEATSGVLDLQIHSDSNSDIYLGGSAVSTTNGFHMRKEETLQMMLYPTNKLYAICSVESQIIVMGQQL